MTFVVTEPCINCTYTDCDSVCSVVRCTDVVTISLIATALVIDRGGCGGEGPGSPLEDPLEEHPSRRPPTRENPRECRYPKGFLRSGGGI